MAAGASLQAALIVLALGSEPGAEEEASTRTSSSCSSCGVVRGVVKTAVTRSPVVDASVLIWPAASGAKPGRVKRPEPPSTEPAWVVSTRTDDDGVTLNGIKAYVPLADTAEKILVYARGADSDTVEGYIVPADTPGVSVEQREALMGLRALPMFRVKFDDVRLPAESRLGGVVGINFQTIADRMNVALAGLAVGVARASFEYARDYAKERVQFGKPVAQNQAIAFMLAEMAI